MAHQHKTGTTKKMTTQAIKKVKRGTFSKVTIFSDQDNVDIVSMDHAKECMAHGWFPDHPIFPKVEHSDKAGVDYTMRKYTTKFVKANLDADQWELYKTIRAIAKEYSLTHENQMNELLEIIEEFRPQMPDDVANAICGAVAAMGLYGEEVGFEISPRNCAIDNGKLIMLDCFFNKEQLREILFNRSTH